MRAKELLEKDKAALMYVEDTPSVKAANKAVSAAQVGQERAHKEYYPELQLQGTYRLDDDYKKEIMITSSGQYTVGLAMVGNVYSGGATDAKVSAAKAELRSKQENLAAVSAKTQSQLSSASASLRGIQQQLPLLRLQLDQAKQARGLYFEEYMVAGRSLVDVMSAENELYRAQTGLVNLEIERMKAITTLLAERGQLSLLL